MITEDEKYLIMSIAKKFNFNNIEFNDLCQAGWVGLMCAKKNFKNNNDTKFTTFAYKYIFGEMYKLANNNRNIKLSKEYLKIYRSIEKTRQCLTQKYKRIPTTKELSVFLEIDEQLIENVIIVSTNTLSLDAENDQSNEMALHNYIGYTHDYETQLLITESLNILNDLGKKIIYYRYFKDYTQQEVAELLGINQVKVSREETISKKKIKEYICA